MLRVKTLVEGRISAFHAASLHKPYPKKPEARVQHQITITETAKLDKNRRGKLLPDFQNEIGLHKFSNRDRFINKRAIHVETPKHFVTTPKVPNDAFLFSSISSQLKDRKLMSEKESQQALDSGRDAFTAKNLK